MVFTNISRKLATRVYQKHPGFRHIQAAIDDTKILASQPLVRIAREEALLEDLALSEFKVFSQWGDDGIIQYLIHKMEIPSPTFVEFGTGNYTESNTRFLLVNDNWRGLIMDSSEENIAYILRDAISWRYDLTAKKTFITRDNIDQLITDARIKGEIGLLSIDIDGNDYWVWDRIQSISPAIVVIEYNAIFGPRAAVTVPYDPGFDRYTAHYSGLFWGASLQALCLLAEKKNYTLVGCNTAGNNAYFIRTDRLGRLKRRTSEEAFRPAKWSDSRHKSGSLNFLRGSQKAAEIASCALFDVEAETTICVADLNLATP